MPTMIILNDFFLITFQNLFLLLTNLHTSTAFNRHSEIWDKNKIHSLIKRKDSTTEDLPSLDWPSSNKEVCKIFTHGNQNEPNTLYSPGWPNNYPNNTDCVTVIRAPEGHILLLEFRERFHIEPSSNCRNDYLEIRDGAFGYNSLLGQLCDRHFPSSITSTGRYLWLHFHSDENTEYGGFKIIYEFRERPNPSIPEIETCRIDVTGNEGFIKVNDIPKERVAIAKEHNLSIECMWVISVPKNWKIYLQFDKFNLAKPNDCEANFLDIFSDRTDLPSKEKNYCGSKADSVISKNNILIVRYFAEVHSITSDFKALYTAFREKDVSSTCNENEYDCEDATCIAIELRCNDNINCRFRWDEDDCNVQKAMLFSSDHIVIVMSIFMLIVFGLCFVFIFRCVKKLVKDHQIIQEHIRQSREMKLDQLGKKFSSTSTNFSTEKKVQTQTTNDSTSCFMITNSVNYFDKKSLIAAATETIDSNIDDNNHSRLSTPEMCDSACQTRESLFNVELTQFDSLHCPRNDHEQISQYRVEALIEMKKIRTNDSLSSSSGHNSNRAPDIIVIH